MADRHRMLLRVREAEAKRLFYLPHALRQMTRPERMISTEEVRAVIAHGEVIEDYPTDPRGHSCLLLGSGTNGRPVHVVCSPKADYFAIITAYIPDSQEWTVDFSVRRKP